MVKFRLLVTVCGAAALAVVTTPALGALSTTNKSTVMQFNQPMRLPGVALPSGTYIFEIANPDSGADMVRVVSRNRSTEYYLGVTRLITRPPGLPSGQSFSFGESAAGTPLPITAWWRENERVGRQFLYPQPN